MFSFYTLGVMSGAAEEVATGAEVTMQSILPNVICTFFVFSTDRHSLIRQTSSAFRISESRNICQHNEVQNLQIANETLK